MATTSRSQNSQYMEFRVETVESKLVCRSNFTESNLAVQIRDIWPSIFKLDIRKSADAFPDSY
jgi:hypothetical protein